MAMLLLALSNSPIKQAKIARRQELSRFCHIGYVRCSINYLAILSQNGLRPQKINSWQIINEHSPDGAHGCGLAADHPERCRMTAILSASFTSSYLRDDQKRTAIAGFGGQAAKSSGNSLLSLQNSLLISCSGEKNSLLLCAGNSLASS
jgi:hypothetical protein